MRIRDVSATLVSFMPRPAPEQLELEVVRIESPEKLRPRRNGSTAQTALGPRLAVSPDEAAAVLGVSRDYFDEHVIGDLRVVRRGRRILVPLAELERWLDRSATRVSVGGRG
jgi:excisionase family DNA binding protein